MKLLIRVRPKADGSYIANCPALPGCESCGPTELQARQNLEQAIVGYLASVSDFVPSQVHPMTEIQSQ